MKKFAPYGKAITGAVVAGLAAARLALTDDVISKAEAIDITVATLTALALVWAIPNKDPEAEHQDESVQPPDVVDEEPDEEPAYQPHMPPTTWQPGGMRARDTSDGDPHRTH